MTLTWIENAAALVFAIALASYLVVALLRADRTKG